MARGSSEINHVFCDFILQEKKRPSLFRMDSPNDNDKAPQEFASDSAQKRKKGGVLRSLSFQVHFSFIISTFSRYS